MIKKNNTGHESRCEKVVRNIQGIVTFISVQILVKKSKLGKKSKLWKNTNLQILNQKQLSEKLLSYEM